MCPDLSDGTVGPKLRVLLRIVGEYSCSRKQVTAGGGPDAAFTSCCLSSLVTFKDLNAHLHHREQCATTDRKTPIQQFFVGPEPTIVLVLDANPHGRHFLL